MTETSTFIGFMGSEQEWAMSRGRSRAVRSVRRAAVTV